MSRSSMIATISMLLSITKLCYLIVMYLYNDYNIYIYMYNIHNLILLVEINYN